MSPVSLLLIVLAEQAQGLQWTGAGVLEVLTALQRQITNQKLSFSQNPCRRKTLNCSDEAPLWTFSPHLRASPVPDGFDDTVIGQSCSQLVFSSCEDTH